MDTKAFPRDAENRSREALPTPEGYEILAELGRGGMGVVYQARQRGTRQLVALKMIRADWLQRLPVDQRQPALAQFRLEAEAAAALRHPNRVRIFHLGEHQGLPYYAMEFIEGCSLADKLKRPGGISKESALKYLAGVAEAVQEAHEHGILHRDLKPHNILIDDRTDEALLTDFGLALMQQSMSSEDSGDDTARYHARMAGTLPYMSPEQIEDADGVAARSDVYGLGITLYEALTGTLPFQGQSRDELIHQILYVNPPSPRQHRPDINRRVERICLQCLNKLPWQRYASARDLAQELRRYLHEVRYTSNFTTMGTLFLALAPVALLINLAVYWLLQTQSSEPVIWATIFSMYPALFSVFLLAPARDGGMEHAVSRREMWSIWGGKMFAAIAISIALRVAFAEQPQRAILLVYPVFAALSGMAAFAMVSKMPTRLYVLAAGCWATAIVMVLNLHWAPIYYGGYIMLGCAVFGLYLRKLGRELR